MENAADSAFWALSKAASALSDSLGGLFAPDSRFFPPYLLIAFVLAALLFYARRRKSSGEEKRNLLAYLFDRDSYLHPSSLVDLKVTLANRLFTPLLSITGRAAIIFSAQATAATLLGSDTNATARPLEDIGVVALIGVTLMVMLASDFTTYWVHRLHHEHPVLWPFHKLHHSAERMTPITFSRKHPVYDLFRALSNVAVLGPVQGVIFALFGIVDIALIFGVNAAYAVFSWTGSNLRHSHIWLSYGPVLSRILISPAQHQIHHSCAPEHHDKNYGEVFAFWDWAFGTLYVPKGFEKLEFGVADVSGERLPQPHSTLREAWMVPFSECADAIADAKKTSGPAATPPTA